MLNRLKMANNTKKKIFEEKRTTERMRNKKTQNYSSKLAAKKIWTLYPEINNKYSQKRSFLKKPHKIVDETSRVNILNMTRNTLLLYNID